MSTWDVSSSKEDTQSRLFRPLSTGCFSWAIITVSSCRRSFFFDFLRQIKCEHYKIVSLTVWTCQHTPDLTFVFSDIWMILWLCVILCVLTKQTALNLRNDHIVIGSFQRLDDSTYLWHVSFAFLALLLFLISANAIKSERTFTSEAQLRLIYLQHQCVTAFLKMWLPASSWPAETNGGVKHLRARLAASHLCLPLHSSHDKQVAVDSHRHCLSEAAFISRQ